MRRSILLLTTVVWLLGSQGLAQTVIPPGQPYPDDMLPGGRPGALQPLPETDSPVAMNHWESPEAGPATMAEAMGPTEGLGPCDETTGDGYSCPPDWYVNQGVQIMHHPKPFGLIVGTRGGITTPTVLSPTATFYRYPSMLTYDLPFSTSPGYNITIGRYLGRNAENRDLFLEFTFTGLNTWQSDCVVRSDELMTVTNASVYPNASDLGAGVSAVFGNLHSMFDVGVSGFNRAQDQSMYYRSRYDNFELNLRFRPRSRVDRLVLQKNGRWQREAQPGLRCSGLVGIRGLSLDEYFYYRSHGTVTAGIGGATTNYDVGGDYDVRAKNDLLGLQVGGEITGKRDRLELGVRGKAGVFINFAEQRSNLSSWGFGDDPLSTLDLDEHRDARSSDVAGAVEVGFTGSFQLRRNLFLRAAYDLMWVSGLALAPEQLDFQVGAPERIRHNGMQFFQTATLGAEFRW